MYIYPALYRISQSNVRSCSSHSSIKDQIQQHVLEESNKFKKMPQLELFVLTWGIYPRRILIYLHEKGLLTSPHLKVTPVTISPTGQLEAPEKPSGTVPILSLPNSTLIKQSVAILDYFEDLCDDPQEEWQKEMAAHTAVGKSMRGRTAEERARTREVLGLADEASSLFGFACHKGSQLFVTLEPTSPVAAGMALEWCKRNLKLLEAYYEDYDKGNTRRFENGVIREEEDSVVTIADCVLFSLLQFSRELYGVDLLVEPDLPNLRAFYGSFKERESARIGEDFYPADIKKLARQWIQ